MVARVALAGLLGVVLLGPQRAAAKSAYYEIENRCPCTGPLEGTFWSSRAERLACIDAAFVELRAEGWPESILARDRQREERSRCGDPRFQCDGTPRRPCPRRTACEVSDPVCSPGGTPGVCQPLRWLRRWHGCRNEPPACDCDGRTHANVCRLWRAGRVLAHPGSCEEGCGGPDRRGCGPDEICLAPNCGDAGEWGVCSPRACSAIPNTPVCGCDGTTYASACDALTAGVGIRAYAACE